MISQDFEKRTRQLIDSLKGVCATYGLGNDGNEFKIIIQVFLYKFLNDRFAFEAKRIDPNLAKSENWEQTLAALNTNDLEKLGGPQTYIQIDLGFGDIVEAIDYSMDLTSTSKGPLFESKIQVRSYPKESIFAEKLETIVHRGMGNTRMKGFHNLRSLISLEKCLDPAYTDKIVTTVFNHRQTQLKLPLKLDVEFIEVLQPLWREYQKDLPNNQVAIKPPGLIQDVISFINSWLKNNTRLCTSE